MCCDAAAIIQGKTFQDPSTVMEMNLVFQKQSQKAVDVALKPFGLDSMVRTSLGCGVRECISSLFSLSISIHSPFETYCAVHNFEHYLAIFSTVARMNRRVSKHTRLRSVNSPLSSFGSHASLSPLRQTVMEMDKVVDHVRNGGYMCQFPPS